MLIDIVVSRSCVMEEVVFFYFDGINLFLFVWGIFYKALIAVSYFVFLIFLLGILPLIKTILIKTQFIHFIYLNTTILLYLQIANLDCNKILTLR